MIMLGCVCVCAVIMSDEAKNSEFECPVCHEDYTEPKILPCAHLVCRNCIIAWLGTGGGQGGCPMCRAPILPPTRPDEGGLDTLVDALITDPGTVALVESHRVLRSPDICTVCQNNVIATSYCFQCDDKLCKSCTQYHQKFSALKDHILEEFSKQSVEQLADSHLPTCKSHPDSSADLYCPAHQELICILCSISSHGSCLNKRTIGYVPELRTELKQRALRLREKETEISTEV